MTALGGFNKWLVPAQAIYCQFVKILTKYFYKSSNIYILRKSRTVSKRHLYDSSSDGSHSDDNKYLRRI